MRQLLLDDFDPLDYFMRRHSNRWRQLALCVRCARACERSGLPKRAMVWWRLAWDEAVAL